MCLDIVMGFQNKTITIFKNIVYKTQEKIFCGRSSKSKRMGKAHLIMIQSIHKYQYSQIIQFLNSDVQ